MALFIRWRKPFNGAYNAPFYRDAADSFRRVDNRLLKQRIIGAAVLVGLAVIFIPMILSGGRDEMPLFGSNIPDKPRSIEKLKSIEIPQPEAIKKPDEVRIPVDEGLPPARLEKQQASGGSKNKSGNLDNIVSRLTPNKKSAAPKAWAVQLGSFSRRENALALQKKLRKNNFAAFVEFIKNRKGGVYRVRIGPEVKREKAEKILQAVQKKLDIKGVVVSHP